MPIILAIDSKSIIFYHKGVFSKGVFTKGLFID